MQVCIHITIAIEMRWQLIELFGVFRMKVSLCFTLAPRDLANTYFHKYC